MVYCRATGEAHPFSVRVAELQIRTLNLLKNATLACRNAHPSKGESDPTRRRTPNPLLGRSNRPSLAGGGVYFTLGSPKCDVVRHVMRASVLLDLGLKSLDSSSSLLERFGKVSPVACQGLVTPCFHSQFSQGDVRPHNAKPRKQVPRPDK